jgi:hypothetical protein
MTVMPIFRVVVLSLICLSLTCATAQDNQWAAQDTSANFPRIQPQPSTSRSPVTRHAAPPIQAPISANNFMPPPCQPQFPCVPQNCKSVNSEPSVYLGYLYKEHGAELQIQNNGPTTAGSTTFTRNDFDLQGIWLELALPMSINENMGLILTGAHLFTLQPTSVQSYSLAGAPSAARQWTPDLQWWEVNAAGSYQFLPSLSGIMGFRWTYFGSNFNNPTNQSGLINPNADSATLTTNAYIPYSGILIENKPDCRSVIKIAAYGSPILPGDFSYTENINLNQAPTSISPKGLFSCGYFFEGFSEYSMRRDLWSMGGFVKFTAVHSERSLGANVGGVNTPVDIYLDRRNWIFGGKMGYTF